MIRIRTAVVVLAIAIPLPAAIAGCGGGSSSSSQDPQQVLDQTFNNPTKITSGNINIGLSGSATGAQSGNVSATIEGPFESNANDPTQFPQFDLNAKVSASGAGQNFSFDGSLIATQDNAFIEYQNQAYEVGTTVFKQFEQAYAKAAKQNQAQGGSNSASSVFSQFGIDPKTWLTNISNEGTTDVDGQSTIHIHGDADVTKVVSDLQKISQATQGSSSTTPQLTPQQLDQLKSSVKSASIDVYSGSDDHLLRKLALAMTITPPAGTGSPVSSVDLNFSITLSDVNQSQTISGPSNAKPITDLLSQLGLSGVPGLGGTTGGSGGFTVPGGGGGSSSAYDNCIANAKTPADYNKCLQKLQ